MDLTGWVAAELLLSLPVITMLLTLPLVPSILMIGAMPSDVFLQAIAYPFIGGLYLWIAIGAYVAVRGVSLTGAWWCLVSLPTGGEAWHPRAVRHHALAADRMTWAPDAAAARPPP
jgi:hypothetical protein